MTHLVLENPVPLWGPAMRGGLGLRRVPAEIREDADGALAQRQHERWLRSQGETIR